MLIDYLFWLFQEIITPIVDTLIQIMMYQKLKSVTLTFNWWKKFFWFVSKNEEEAYEKIIDIGNNNDYTTGNLLDFAYLKKTNKLIAIDLSEQTKLKDPQQINFIGKLSRRSGATMFFIIEKSEETTFNFSQNSATII